jgi:hypothetical protein
MIGVAARDYALVTTCGMVFGPGGSVTSHDFVKYGRVGTHGLVAWGGDFALGGEALHALRGADARDGAAVLVALERVARARPAELWALVVLLVDVGARFELRVFELENGAAREVDDDTERAGSLHLSLPFDFEGDQEAFAQRLARDVGASRTLDELVEVARGAFARAADQAPKYGSRDVFGYLVSRGPDGGCIAKKILKPGR